MRHSTAGEGTGSRPRCYRQRGRRTGRVHAQEKISRRKPANANAGRPGRHEKAHAELTGAGGNHSPSTCRVRHCWLADVDLAPAFVRNNHVVSWTAGNDTGRLHGPRAHPRGHGSAVDCGPQRTGFPHFIMTRRLPTKQLLRLTGRAIRVLKYLEKAVHPRWPITFEAAKRAVGVVVLLLTAVLLLTPVPLSNVAPATVISLISLAYVEEDGLLLSVALLAAIILIGLGSML